MKKNKDEKIADKSVVGNLKTTSNVNAVEQYVRPMVLSNAEFSRIAQCLDGYHALFYQFWTMGKPYFTNMIETAAVTFNKEGEYTNFLFNPEFWERMTPRQRLFVIGHECLHVILKHGIRSTESKYKDIANIAMDVVVNHMLVNKFSFEREDAPFDLLNEMAAEKQKDADIQQGVTEDRKEDAKKGGGCWVDTVFPGENVPTNKSYEYYYNLIMKRVKFIKIDMMTLLNSHEGLTSKEFSEKIIKQLDQKLTDEEKDSLKDLIEKQFKDLKEGLKEHEVNETQDPGDGGKYAGQVGGHGFHFVQISRVPKKKKWETIIQKWSRAHAYEDIEIEQWAHINRRYTNLPEDMMIPSMYEDEDKRKGRIEVYFFLDTSGSCAHLADRFFKAAMSLPEERFDTKLFCFDTRVFPVDKKEKKLQGFGGTSFSCIEQYIQSYIKAGDLPYPAAVFVITDGYGDAVSPQSERDWYWFLSEDYQQYIPKASNRYKLADFE